MTYLIQHTKTRAYFQKGTWTLYSVWAEEFSDLTKAMTACLRHELREVELILRFGSEAGRIYSLHLSLPEQILIATKPIVQAIPASTRRSASSLAIW